MKEKENNAPVCRVFLFSVSLSVVLDTLFSTLAYAKYNEIFV